jgi:hypothetical protein
MNARSKMLVCAGWLALAVGGGGFFAFAQDGRKLDANKIGTTAGTKATTTKDGIVRIAWARTDVPVRVDGMPLKPFAGLGSWAAFTATRTGRWSWATPWCSRTRSRRRWTPPSRMAWT